MNIRTRRPFPLAFALALGALLAPAPAQIVNGGFENPTPLFGWTVEYATYSGACSYGTWTTALPSGHPAPGLWSASTPLYPGQTLPVLPYEGKNMARINDPVGGYHATRIWQSFSPTAADVASSVLSVQWGAMLVNGDHVGCNQPGMSIEVLLNSTPVMSFAADADTAIADGWLLAGNVNGALYYK